MKNIAIKCLVFTLALLMTDACPDFSDCAKDFSASRNETSSISYLLDCITGDFSNSDQSNPSDTASTTHDHSIEIDAFLLVYHPLCNHFVLQLTQIESIYQNTDSDVVIDVIPMPPTILG